MRKLLYLVFFSLAFFCLNTEASSLHYLAVLNAGSTGSRLYLYAYDPSSPINPQIPQFIADKKVAPGIASLANSIDPNNPTVLTAATKQYLAPLLSFIQTQEPSVKAKDITFYLLATAGMRVLSQDQQTVIYQNVGTIIDATGYTIGSIQTIPGKMEGTFDWIALNQLLGKLGYPAEQTAGVLDMGGASTELTFASSSAVSNDDNVSFILGNQSYTLYSHSYLGLGQDEARSQYLNDPNCFPVDYQLPNGNKGNGHFAQCQLDTNQLLQQVHKVQRVIPANTNMPFYAIAGFAYTANSKYVFNLGADLSTAALTQVAEVQCAKNWKDLTQQDPADPFLYSDCFNAALETDLLRDYGFNSSQALIATNDVDDSSIDWTLGAAIYYLNQH